jgi:hypothetical protein
LSITSAYLGPRVTRSLGLRPYTPPWYPLIRMPINAIRGIVARILPGGLDRAAVRGWRQQQAFMRTIASDPATIGHSAQHVMHAA